MARRKGLTFYQKKKKLNIALIHEIISWIFWIVMSIILALLVVYCIGMKTSIIGSSMEPSLYNGQEIFLNRLVYKITSPKAGDVVVFLPNGNEKSHYYVKRVVAVPGDELYVKSGILYVNNEVQDEYINDKIAEAGLAENKIEITVITVKIAVLPILEISGKNILLVRHGLRWQHRAVLWAL